MSPTFASQSDKDTHGNQKSPIVNLIKANGDDNKAVQTAFSKLWFITEVLLNSEAENLHDSFTLLWFVHATVNSIEAYILLALLDEVILTTISDSKDSTANCW
jgi:hypothetical protein